MTQHPATEAQTEAMTTEPDHDIPQIEQSATATAPSPTLDSPAPAQSPKAAAKKPAAKKSDKSDAWQFPVSTKTPASETKVAKPKPGKGASGKTAVAAKKGAVGAKVKMKTAKPNPDAVKSKPAAKKSEAKESGKSESRSKNAARPKAKLVRDSFTMPQDDYALIAGLKDRALKFKRHTKKSELLRAGLHALQSLSAADLRKTLDQLAPLKPGRPRSDAA
jgi:hypothetical protein